MSQSLKSLKIIALKAQNKLLQEQLKRAKEKLTNQKLEELKNLEQLHQSIMDKNTLICELDQYKAAYKEAQEKADRLNQDIVRYLSMLSLDVLIPNAQMTKDFFKFRDEGNHIQCIKTLQNSNTKLQLTLKAAKDLYESKYRDLKKFPMDGSQPKPNITMQFKVNQKVRALTDAGYHPFNIEKGSIYEIQTVIYTCGEIIVKGVNARWKENLFETYEAPRVKKPGEFLPGDKVICIDDGNTDCILTHGEIYIVQKGGSSSITLEGIGAEGWSVNRFKHVE